MKDYRNMKENFVFKTKEYHYIQQIKCSMEEDKLKQDRKESKGKQVGSSP